MKRLLIKTVLVLFVVYGSGYLSLKHTNYVSATFRYSLSIDLLFRIVPGFLCGLIFGYESMLPLVKSTSIRLDVSLSPAFAAACRTRDLSLSDFSIPSHIPCIRAANRSDHDVVSIEPHGKFLGGLLFYAILFDQKIALILFQPPCQRKFQAKDG